jgi:predicted O-methyltransferase YrrM
MSELSLDAIGVQFGTDKSSRHHNYLNFYERHFAARRHEPLTILEIGVLNGASLRTWREYFPNAKIVGCDIDPTVRRWAAARIEIEYMDQSNLEDLVRVAVKHGPLDIIIEDGSHLWEHQITTLRTLFPFLRPDGIYVVEDLQTNFGEFQSDYRGNAQRSCVEFLKDWLDLHVADNALPSQSIEDSFLRTYGRGARAITFYKRCCLIEKKALPLPLLAQPLKPLAAFEPSANHVNATLTAHLSHVGDVYAPECFVDLGHDRFTFQGIALDDPEHVLEYRVRGADLNFGPWLPAPEFAGTRGRALIVTGVTIRVREADRGKFKLLVIGRFVGDEKLVVASDGEDCVAEDNADLRGLQVILERIPPE